MDQIESMWFGYDQSRHNGLKMSELAKLGPINWTKVDRSTQHKYKRNKVLFINSYLKCNSCIINKYRIFNV